MKKIGIIFIIAILTLSLGACGSKQLPDVEKNATEIVEEVITPIEEATESIDITDELENELPEGFIKVEEPLQVMGAEQYRGTVTSVTGDVIVLEQYEGTDFGQPSITANITTDTRSNFDIKLLAVGQYLEVYYGVSLDSTEMPEIVDAVAINYLGKAEERNFNAIVTSVNVLAENPKEGSITVTDLKGENETVFNFKNDGSTQIYLNFEEIVVGAKLSIFHKPMMTMSLPPQIFAEEIRLYAEN